MWTKERQSCDLLSVKPQLLPLSHSAAPLFFLIKICFFKTVFHPYFWFYFAIWSFFLSTDVKPSSRKLNTHIVQIWSPLSLPVQRTSCYPYKYKIYDQSLKDSCFLRLHGLVLQMAPDLSNQKEREKTQLVLCNNVNQMWFSDFTSWLLCTEETQIDFIC